MSINEQNAKQIRDSMEVYCGISARMASDLNFEISGETYVVDTNVSASLDSELWDMRSLSDLSGEGFSLNKNVNWHNTSLAGSEENGKIGIRSNIGGSLKIKVSSEKIMNAITIAVTKGTGQIKANNISYEIRRIVVIPVNSDHIELEFENNSSDDRIEIASITPGIVMEFQSDNLISCELSLRSDLSIENPTWPVSDIEIKAYWPDDISEAISNVGDDVPIWYYAGYDGDYSPERNFYLSEKASMEENVITIRGEDSSAKLEDENLDARVLNSSSKTGRKYLYNRFCNVIKDAGISLVRKESPPVEASVNETKYTAVFLDQTARDIVQEIINLSHNSTFWPIFVDAGIPVVTWSKPVAKWDIFEEDCGSVIREVARNISKIKSSNSEYGISTKAERKNEKKELARRNVEAGKRYSFNDNNFYWQLSVSNATNVIARASKIIWTANKDTTTKKVNGVTKKINQSVVEGKRVSISTLAKSISESNKRPGITVSVEPKVLGKVYQGTTLIFPNYNSLFKRSNITGAFEWKGDPRMQPRDVFRFHRLDGSVEECTIENIIMKHEGGGTKAEISYRKGIV